MDWPAPPLTAPAEEDASVIQLILLYKKLASSSDATRMVRELSASSISSENVIENGNAYSEAEPG